MPTITVQQLQVSSLSITSQCEEGCFYKSKGICYYAITLANWHLENLDMDEFRRQKRLPVPLGLHP